MNRWQMAKEILDWRLEHDLSYRQAAEVLGINPRTLFRWQHGQHEPSASLLALCRMRMRQHGEENQ